jgi:type II secretory pathway pseudopilin PulG
MTSKTKKLKFVNLKSGFSLIETTLYIALFSIFIGGSLISVYNLSESGLKNSDRALITDEGNFISSKIDFIIEKSSTINLPPDNSSSIILSVIPNNTASGSPIILSKSGDYIEIKKGTNTPIKINGENFPISNLNFYHFTASTSTTTLKYIRTSFVLKSKTRDGKKNL